MGHQVDHELLEPSLWQHLWKHSWTFLHSQGTSPQMAPLSRL
jgi:hypothetical protein